MKSPKSPIHDRPFGKLDPLWNGRITREMRLPDTVLSMTTPNFEDKRLWVEIEAAELAEHKGDWLSYAAGLNSEGEWAWGLIEEVSIEGEVVSVRVVGGTRIHRFRIGDHARIVRK